MGLSVLGFFASWDNFGTVAKLLFEIRVAISQVRCFLEIRNTIEGAVSEH